jgi:hypothetical protein
MTDPMREALQKARDFIAYELPLTGKFILPDLDAALALPVPQDRDAWQLIETAPRDGTLVDLWSKDRRRLTDCYWLNDAYSREIPFGWSNSRYGRITDATHWTWSRCGR